MTPKEKADELLDAMSTNYGDEHHHCTLYVAKNCALIVVDEVMQKTLWDKGEQRFWKEVKKELELL